MVLVDFYEKGTGSGYWDTGELPDIDLQNDKLFVILDQDSYYQTQEHTGNGVQKAVQRAVRILSGHRRNMYSAHAGLLQADRIPIILILIMCSAIFTN